MSLDFDVQRCTRKCTATERNFEPGETFYSVLETVGEDVIRKDFSAEAWTGPPEDAVGWWQSQMPDPNAQKVEWAPNDVIVNYFDRIKEVPAKAETCYVLTLLMIRRRLMRLEETERDAAGNEVMVLFCPRTEKEHRVVSQDPSPDNVAAIQDELLHLLFGNGGESSDPAAST